jgi:hypothetical protein
MNRLETEEMVKSRHNSTELFPEYPCYMKDCKRFDEYRVNRNFSFGKVDAPQTIELLYCFVCTQFIQPNNYQEKDRNDG